MQGRFARIVVTVLACWLTMLASGDDFNVCRIAIPILPAEATADTLPLDDPNTDFTRADSCHSVHGNGSPDIAFSMLLPWQQDNSLSSALQVGCFLDPSPPFEPLGPPPFSCLRC